MQVPMSLAVLCQLETTSCSPSRAPKVDVGAQVGGDLPLALGEETKDLGKGWDPSSGGGPPEHPLLHRRT